MKPRSGVLPIAAAALLVGSAALALGARTAIPGSPRGHRPPRAVLGLGLAARLAEDPDLQTRVGLSPEQVLRLRSVAKQGRESLVRLRADLRIERIEMRSLLRDVDTPRTDLEKQADALARARQALGRAVTATLLEAREILTRDQRLALRSEMQRRVRERILEGNSGGGGATGDARARGEDSPLSSARRDPAAEASDGTEEP